MAGFFVWKLKFPVIAWTCDGMEYTVGIAGRRLWSVCLIAVDDGVIVPHMHGEYMIYWNVLQEIVETHGIVFFQAAIQRKERYVQKRWTGRRKIRRKRMVRNYIVMKCMVVDGKQFL